MFKKILVVTAVMLLTAGLVLAESRMRKTAEVPGNLELLQGTLANLDSEWYLESGGITYELHFGNRRYLEDTGMVPMEGAPCTVRGFVDGHELIVSEIELEGKTFRFRDEEGIPLWSRGRNAGTNGSHGERRGALRGSAGRGSGPRNGTGSRHGATS